MQVWGTSLLNLRSLSVKPFLFVEQTLKPNPSEHRLIWLNVSFQRWARTAVDAAVVRATPGAVSGSAPSGARARLGAPRAFLGGRRELPVGEHPLKVGPVLPPRSFPTLGGRNQLPGSCPRGSACPVRRDKAPRGGSSVCGSVSGASLPAPEINAGFLNKIA